MPERLLFVAVGPLGAPSHACLLICSTYQVRATSERMYRFQMGSVGRRTNYFTTKATNLKNFHKVIYIFPNGLDPHMTLLFMW